MPLAAPKKLDVALPANLVCGLPMSATVSAEPARVRAWAPIEVSKSGVPEVLPEWVASHADVRIVDVRETNLLTFDGVSGGVLAIDPAVGEVRAGDAARTVVLPILPARCDPHAVQEDKRGTVFGVDVDLDGEDEAAADGLAVEQDGAGAAIAAAAAFLGRLDAELAAQHVEQGFVGGDRRAADLPVQADGDFPDHCASSSMTLMP